MKIRLFILALSSVLLFTACQKEAISSTDGFGTSTKPLTGTPYSFPSGVALNGSIVTDYYYCGGTVNNSCNTVGDLSFYFPLHNSNNTPTTVIFPAGMVIPCADTTIQGAVLVQPDTVILPPATVICVSLDAHCINENRTFNNNQIYMSPLISNNANLTPLIKLLATKKTITNDPNQILQHTVWDIANTGQMTAADIAAINAFP
jgi:hypothetical protein